MSITYSVSDHHASLTSNFPDKWNGNCSISTVAVFISNQLRYSKTDKSVCTTIIALSLSSVQQ